MARGRKTGGRQKGSRNHTTEAAIQAIDAAFKGLGGVPALLAWGKADPANFYRIWSKRIPQAQSVELSGAGGGPMVVQVEFVAEGRRITRA